MNNSTPITRSIEKIFNIGLVDINENEFFSWQGCDYCNAVNGKILGATVCEVKGYMDLHTAQTDKDDYYSFQLCPECLCQLTYGENNEDCLINGPLLHY